MSLTVPRAGTEAGRAARPVPQPAPVLGEELAELGQAAAQVGVQIEEDRLSRQRQQLRVDLTGDFNELRLKAKEIGDPDRLDQWWTSQREALRQQYLQGQTDEGDPRVDPRNVEEFERAFQSLEQQHRFEIGQRSLALRMSGDAVRRQNMAAELDQTAMMDPETREAALAQYDALIDEQVASGRLEPAEGNEMKLERRAALEEAAALRSLAEDPEGLVEGIEEGAYPHLAADQRERFRARAVTAIDKAEQKAREERQQRIDDRLDRIASLDDPSRISEGDRRFLQSEAARASDAYPEAAAALSLADQEPDLARLTPDELGTLIEREKARPVAHKWQEERLRLLQSIRDRAVEGWQTDPIGRARRIGLDVPELPAFDTDDELGFRRAMARREQFAEQLEERGYTDEAPLFSEEEREKLGTMAAPQADPADRFRLARRLAQGLGKSRAQSAAAELSDDPLFRFSAHMMTTGAQHETYRDMLKGARKIADKSVTLPARDRFVQTFLEETDGVFADQPALTRQLIDGARALYAESNPGDDSTSVDAGAMAAAIDRALGQLPGPRPAGGLAEIDGEKLPLPPGLKATTAETTLEQVRALIGRGTTIRRDREFTKERSFDALTAAAIEGATTPDLGQNRPDADPQEIWDQMRVAPYWPDGRPTDRYVLTRQMGGRTVVVRDVEDRVYTFSLRSLANEVRR